MHGSARELARLGDACATGDHRREQALQVVRPAMAVQLGDVLAGERRRPAHRERQHLIDPRAPPRSCAQPTRTSRDRASPPPSTSHAIAIARGPLSRTIPTPPTPAAVAIAAIVSSGRLTRLVTARGRPGTTRMWRSSPSPSLRLDSPGISAIAMWTMRRSCGVIGWSSTICLVCSAFSPIFCASDRSRSTCLSRKPPASTTSGLPRARSRSPRSP